jgi:hypothetical protein
VAGQGAIKSHEFADPLSGNYLKRPKSLSVASAAYLSALDPHAPYIWVVNENGDLIIAIEENLDGAPARRGERTLGHPTLVNGDLARIGGELRFVEGEWVITNKSGRYGRNRPAERLLPNVAAIFKGLGLSVTWEAWV